MFQDYFENLILTEKSCLMARPIVELLSLAITIRSLDSFLASKDMFKVLVFSRITSLPKLRFAINSSALAVKSVKQFDSVNST